MKQKNNREGWVCPKCGAVMNPDAMVCVNCVGNKELYCAINIEQPKIINNSDQIANDVKIYAHKCYGVSETGE